MYRYLILIITIILFTSCENMLVRRGHVAIDRLGDESCQMTTWSDGSITFYNNKKRITLLENSILTCDDDVINLKKGIIIYNKKVSHGSIVPQIFGNGTWGSLLLYRLTISGRLGDITGDVVIDYQDNSTIPSIEVPLQFLFKRRGRKYYGFLIPISVYRENEKIEVVINLYKRGKYFGLIKTSHDILKREWEKQTIYFQRSKSSELQKSDRSLYVEQLKVRKKILAEISLEYYSSDGFILPLKKEGKITSEFGLRREWRFHNGRLYIRNIHMGVDFGRKSGTEILAAGNGIVRYAQNGVYIGNTVIIEHGLGLYTDYSHMKSMDVKPGDVIKKGDIIGYVGMTGASTGPHLHWGARVYGQIIDPRSIMDIEPGF